MGARLDGDDDGIISDINVTPLVDVTLVLLIIFMVTATYIVAPSIQVQLPKAASGEQTQQSTLAVVLTKENQLYLNGQPTTEEALAAFIVKERQTHPEVQAIISADAAVAHGQVIRLIDLVKLNGVTKLAFNIDPQVVEDAGNGKPVPAPAAAGGTP